MFRFRSHNKELLDAENIPQKDLFQNLKELEFINHWLGGHKISIEGINKIVEKHSKNNLTLLDIGCGGGDNLRAMHRSFKADKIRLKLYGADLKQDCIDYAIQQSKNFPEITYCCDDFRAVNIPELDIIHASLFFHHFSEQEIINFIKSSIDKGVGLIINDLERNPIAYYAINYLTKLFSKSYLVKHDAALSVLRGFKKQEWVEILSSAGARNYSIYNKWAFRHLIIIYPNGQ